jgi:hypothetical protein
MGMIGEGHNRLNEEIKKLALKHDLTVSEGYDIIKHEFKMLSDILSTTTLEDRFSFPNYYIMHLGLFGAKSSVQTWLTNKYLK